jgi:hypothetical protein
MSSFLLERYPQCNATVALWVLDRIKLFPSPNPPLSNGQGFSAWGLGAKTKLDLAPQSFGTTHTLLCHCLACFSFRIVVSNSSALSEDIRT